MEAFERESKCCSASGRISGQKRSLPLDVVLLRIESFGSFQAEEPRLYVHLTDILTFHRDLVLWVGENTTAPPSLFSTDFHRNCNRSS